MPEPHETRNDSIEGPVARRLLRNPSVHSGLCPRIGNNINGPSVVQVPDWVGNALGRYHLYFAHHEGGFIRLAFAETLDGPWTVYEPSVLNLVETGFVKTPVPWADEAGNLTQLAPHIASPDVHIDTEQRRFVMYFHGLLPDGTQATRMATSDNGLNFIEVTGDLAPAYLRCAWWRDTLYGLAWGGELFRATNWEGPFEKGPPHFEAPEWPQLTSRHPVLHFREDTLHVFQTFIGDCPERIWHSSVALADKWEDWIPGRPRRLLNPQEVWEGVDEPARPSRIGPAHGLENALRDPYVIGDHLFYAGGGESAIGVARLTWPR